MSFQEPGQLLRLYHLYGSNHRLPDRALAQQTKAHPSRGRGAPFLCRLISSPFDENLTTMLLVCAPEQSLPIKRILSHLMAGGKSVHKRDSSSLRLRSGQAATFLGMTHRRDTPVPSTSPNDNPLPTRAGACLPTPLRSGALNLSPTAATRGCCSRAAPPAGRGGRGERVGAARSGDESAISSRATAPTPSRSTPDRRNVRLVADFMGHLMTFVPERSPCSGKFVWDAQMRPILKSGDFRGFTVRLAHEPGGNRLCQQEDTGANWTTLPAAAVRPAHAARSVAGTRRSCRRG